MRNVNDGISMVQIMDSTYDEVTSILQRMRDMAVQAANGSLAAATEKTYLETEKDKLITALDSALDQAKFGTTDLVGDDGSGVSVSIQAGADTGDAITVALSATAAGDASKLGVGANLIDLTTDASAAIGLLMQLSVVASQRATAHQAQLSQRRNLSNVAEHRAAAGRIMDTDYAAETANLTKAQILQQAATSVLH